MANFFEDKDRRVIPNFRSLKTSERLGELKSFSAFDKRSFISDPHFDNLVKDWENNQTIGYAADLISTGLLVSPKNEAVLEVAKFILDSKESSPSQKSIAFLVLGNEMETIEYEKKNLNWFLNQNNVIYNRIAFIKKQMSQFPRNALNYVEISRLYLIIGQEEKAKQYMSWALYLGPNNRYVLRSAVRLFVHYGDFDLPHFYLRKFPNLKNDPWLLSAEIALSTIRERNSRFIKNGLVLLDSKNHTDFSKTELSAALGTVELFNGSFKKSKRLFQKSLDCPNDNSLAQVEWATNKGRLFNLNPNDFQHVENKYEALSRDSYHNQNWSETINNVEKWFIDSPFSKSPTMLGSYVSLTYLDQPGKSIDFCKAGLVSHPFDPELINNLSYSYGILNDIENAEKYINSVDISIVQDNRVKNCLNATKGLIEFRKGKVDKGRELYLKVLEDTKSRGYYKLNKLATLNLSREEILSNSSGKEEIVNLIDKLKLSEDELGLKILKDKVLDLSAKQDKG